VFSEKERAGAQRGLSEATDSMTQGFSDVTTEKFINFNIIPFIMSEELNQKNEFVLSLREHLMSKYSTKHHYTCGEGDFEGQKIGSAYCLVRRDPNTPRDISGFCFRRDLCSWAPQNASDVLKDVYDFSQREKNLESVLDKQEKKLTITFGNRKYSVTSYIDKGYAGEISVSFMELPLFLRK